jgi:hypothetical protein
MEKFIRYEFAYNNRWLSFVNAALITVVVTLALFFFINEFLKSSQLHVLAIFFVANVASMLLTGMLLLAYIHYKSPYNNIKFDHDSIFVPNNKILPDAHCIYCDQIIYHHVIEEEFDQYLKIVYNGGSLIIYRSHLKNPEDWNELIYNFKEMII